VSKGSFVELDQRGVLVVAGADRVAFLQGLVSNDVGKLSPERAIYAALLTAQGKYLHDFFLAARGEIILVEGEAARLSDLQRRLSLYKLRAKVTVAADAEGSKVYAAFGTGALAALGLPEDAGAARPFAGGIAFVDPRLPALGARLILAAGEGAAALGAAGLEPAEFAAYDRLRLAQGVPDGSRDLVVEKAILLEAGFEELNGVDWQKGCYVGQELTARTKYRGLIKKRLLPVRIDGPAPAPGTIIRRGVEEAGEMRSARDGIGLALLRLEAIDAVLEAEGARLTPVKPDWARF
jgi:folate-binding protein YgfZ